MQHELDHFTKDWVSELTGKNRDKDEFINQQHRHGIEASQCRCLIDDDQVKACGCDASGGQPIQMCFNILQDEWQRTD